ncbi:MAG: DUF6869 domain-containing protein [Planctomycetota bacterium]|jgi:hypothetical protein
MPIDERWEQLSAEDWDAFAQSWLAELREPEKSGESEFGQSVVMMGFTAPADSQWTFIVAALKYARTDDELGHIAAGPLECLLGRHGDDMIDSVETCAASDAKFARALTGVLQYQMTDEVWRRVREIQLRVREPLVSDDRE